MLSDLPLVFRSLANAPGFTAVALLTLALATSGCTLVTGHRIADGTKGQGSYHTVAGAVHVGREATIDSAKTIAGAIHVGQGAATRSLSTIAGEVRIDESAKVDGDVSTIAGGIRIDAGASVTGKVTSIAGAIELNGCHIGGLVGLTKGSLETRGVTLLPGRVVVHHTNSSDGQHPTRIDLGPGAEVASVTVESGANVDLRISREARVGPVTGASATYY